MEPKNIVSEHNHREFELKLRYRIIINLFVIVLLFFALRPFIAAQIANRGDRFLSYGMYKNAVKKYKTSLFLDAYKSENWNWLGYAYELLGEKDKAIEIYNKAVSLDPNNRIAYHDAGMIYMRNGDYKTAGEYFLKASRVDLKYKTSVMEDNYSFHRSALRMLAYCYEKLGLNDKAVEVNNEILKYYPDDKVVRDRQERLTNIIENP